MDSIDLRLASMSILMPLILFVNHPKGLFR